MLHAHSSGPCSACAMLLRCFSAIAGMRILARSESALFGSYRHEIARPSNDRAAVSTQPPGSLVAPFREAARKLSSRHLNGLASRCVVSHARYSSP